MKAQSQGEQKPDCSKHKRDLFGESFMPNVARAIADLHYETLAELFDCLIHEFHNDAVKDAEDGRYSLAGSLENASHNCRLVFENIELAFEISKPFMTKPLQP